LAQPVVKTLVMINILILVTVFIDVSPQYIY